MGGLSCKSKTQNVATATNIIKFEMTIPITLNAMPFLFLTAQRMIPIMQISWAAWATQKPIMDHNSKAGNPLLGSIAEYTHTKARYTGDTNERRKPVRDILPSFLRSSVINKQSPFAVLSGQLKCRSLFSPEREMESLPVSYFLIKRILSASHMCRTERFHSAVMLRERGCSKSLPSVLR